VKRVGYFLLVLSFLMWGLVILIPFTGLSRSDMAAYAAVLYVVSYALFFAGGFLVGKEAISDLKDYVWHKLGRSKPSVESSSTDESSPES
jgi:cytochrome c biogenesis factor